ncbi:LPS assembly lipoprotein LptE [Acidiphilium sp.]|uniref:LPS assembly lipoprotein LptE n=1 Tax=Acidiphilium sp. TaxID=527 RepID=UPI003CFBF811
MSARSLLALPCVLVLAGCGLHPLYGPQHGHAATIAARLDEIDIGLIADRQGQVMREALESDLQRDGAPSFYRYHLSVQYGMSVQIIGIQPDSSNTRNRYFGNAHWVLSPEGNQGVTIAQGNAQAMDAENIIDNQYFANTLDNGTMRHQLARELAHQITTQLAIYFRAHPDHGA